MASGRREKAVMSPLLKSFLAGSFSGSCRWSPLLSNLCLSLLFQSPLLKSFLAGSFSGSCSTVLFQPLDLVKTRLQASVLRGNSPSGMATVLWSVIKDESPRALWKGVVPSLTRVVPGVGLHFSALHLLRSALNHPPSATEALLIGGSARALAGAATIPATVIKTRCESGIYDYRGVAQALQLIYRTEGHRGLTRGLLPTLLRDVPFSSFYFMFYSQARGALPTEVTSGQWGDLATFCCGLVSGLGASVVTQPADVVKTRVQLTALAAGGSGSLTNAIGLIYQEGGSRAFFYGLAPRVLRRTFMAAMAWTVYERVSKTF
ncbi:Mitochondrial glycine transporter [Amphibalanus amphitrite]|uniref:Mitochondrial glycine transporter n=1 Tax=Amphibalanus amphitrite TaxID=1232801 RepID=A0A6A4VAL1_AMPAM|nr:Mitochondrial glycine transporter [Amphibalanus amphitrite]